MAYETKEYIKPLSNIRGLSHPEETRKDNSWDSILKMVIKAMYQSEIDAKCMVKEEVSK